MMAQTWLSELARELAVRGLKAPEVASIVVEAEGHLDEAALSPLAVFGAPARYASRVVAALDPIFPIEHPPGPVRVSASGLVKRLGRRRVLNGVELELRAGQAVLVLGPNGCGKSTLLRLLAGLLAPDEGRVHVDGSVGYAPQHGGLVEHLRPAEHFLLFGSPRGLSREAALREGQRLAEQLGWDALGAPIVGQLSGGTRQKLNVALAALADPDVLLLDEPYQGLDLESMDRFWDLVWSWRDGGSAVVFVSHQRDAIELADAVVELNGAA